MTSDSLTHCVSCGKRLRTGCEKIGNHHCSAQFERRRAAVNRREEDEAPRDKDPTFEERLAEGFALLGNNG